MTRAVGDDEQVFRRVQECVGDQFCFRIENGKTVFLHAAFNDPANNPSVDRAILKFKGDPHLSRRGSQDGVVSLQVAAIRLLGPIPKLNEKGKPSGVQYTIDVIADPALLNCSHSLVVMSPSASSKGTFRRLKDGLVRLANDAGWKVEPNSELPRRYVYQFKNFLICLLHHIRGQ